MTDVVEVANESTQLSWLSEPRLVRVRYTRDAVLESKDGDFLVDALTSWIGRGRVPFAVFADAEGLEGVDAEYRAKAGAFFREHHDTGVIALINLGPIVRVVAELFRVATSIQMRTFASEDAARSWIRTKGIAA